MQKVKPLAIKGDVLDEQFTAIVLPFFLGVANMYIHNTKVVGPFQL